MVRMVSPAPKRGAVCVCAKNYYWEGERGPLNQAPTIFNVLVIFFKDL